ncbi:deacylase/carboxypeptidase superfamily protein [Planotetraspora thailandica]|uniref:Deacylase/carboxypeptidase superfamily protein n=1 Tax=Planotetraspora thailandica TaxID=487172 RepID=A0A8J3XV62_9ACTN|nr:M14 family zinc carboxypeptidase [Planotetraspora thailandica]GII53959.1 deacylase/carboxypeptidase superfamily protein [Planotetraspora thailandica]
MRPRAATYRRFPYGKVTSVAAVALTAATMAFVPPASANSGGPKCSPDTNAHLASVPTPEAFFGFPLGKGQPRVVTTGEIRAYVDAVGKASDRVVTGTMAHSVSGQELPYAIVSGKDHMSRGELDDIAEEIRSLRDPRSLRPDKAAHIAKDTPAIVWIAGNVHGGETSGADAALKTLYELSSGLSCDVAQRNENLVTVIVPTQNPDGRDANRRQNDYGFDLNRDWFARTQPETDGKIAMLRDYPPQVFVDAHEMGGRQFFFPPNADPIHHEIADQPVDWINRIGAANSAAFGYNGACTATVTTECYFNYATYDLFYMGYGDTVPATGFGAAGMTYEKGSSSAVEDRVQQQFNTQWATTGWAAANKREVLGGYYKIWQTALAEGKAGTLEPNEVVQPTNTVQFPVPDTKIRSYFLLPGRQIGDVRRLVERLRGMDVEVYRLDRSLKVPNAQIFGGRSAKNFTVPEGAYWIPMDQPQKHWIQALLGEDPHVPFPYFYDVSSWSNPLLMGVDTIYTGDALSPKADLVKRIDGGVASHASRSGSYTYPLDSAAASELTFRLLGSGVPVTRDLTTGVVSLPARSIKAGDLDDLARPLGVTVTGSHKAASGTALRLPDTGLFAGTGISTTSGSYGEARYVLGARWGLDLKPVTTADINGNTPAFTERTTLVVPDGSNSTGGLTAQGLANLKAWVAAGGTYVGLRNEGTRVARAAGLTSTTEKAKPTGYQVIGSHFRVDVDGSSPVALGRPAEDFQFNNSDPILNPSQTGTNVITYPSDDTFWGNGYTVGAEALKGTASLVDEPIGSGHAVLFAYNPLFRAYNENGIHLVANALLHPASAPAVAAMRTAAAQPETRSEALREAAAKAAEPADLGGQWRPISIEVAQDDLARTEAVIRRYTDTAQVAQAGGSAYFTIPNPEGLAADEHPFLRDMVNALQSARIPLRSVVG